jgi:hypothetical protein
VNLVYQKVHASIPVDIWVFAEVSCNFEATALHSLFGALKARSLCTGKVFCDTPGECLSKLSVFFH